MPQEVGLGQNVGLRDFCHIRTLLPPGASVFDNHMSSYIQQGMEIRKGLRLDGVNVYLFLSFCCFSISSVNPIELCHHSSPYIIAYI